MGSRPLADPPPSLRRKAAAVTDAPSTALPPHVALRVAVTTGRRTTRSDLVLVGSRGSVHTPLGSPDATISEFAVSRLWPTVRALLPADSVARSAPAVTRPADRVPVDAEEHGRLRALGEEIRRFGERQNGREFGLRRARPGIRTGAVQPIHYDHPLWE